MPHAVSHGLWCYGYVMSWLHGVVAWCGSMGPFLCLPVPPVPPESSPPKNPLFGSYWEPLCGGGITNDGATRGNDELLCLLLSDPSPPCLRLTLIRHRSFLAALAGSKFELGVEGAGPLVLRLHRHEDFSMSQLFTKGSKSDRGWH